MKAKTACNCHDNKKKKKRKEEARKAIKNVTTA